MLVSKNITKSVRAIIDNDLSFQDAMQRGYCNLSAMARLIKPSIDAIAGNDVSLESIVTALKRIRSVYKVPYKSVEPIIAGSKISLRTDVAKLSIVKNKKTVEKVAKPLTTHYDGFISVTESVNSMTLIFDQLILERLKNLFDDKQILEVESDLAAIIVQSPEEIIKTPGCALIFYNQLARRHINIEDTISCYTDTIMLVNMNDVAKAFNALTELITESRKTLGKPKSKIKA
jgi:aspartokinase